jgi:hypothetical protein
MKPFAIFARAIEENNGLRSIAVAEERSKLLQEDECFD